LMEEMSSSMRVRVYVIRVWGDNPKLSTALKLVRHGLAIRISPEDVPRGAIVLDPTSHVVLAPRDREYILKSGLVVIDSSWNRGVNDIVSVIRKLRECRRRILPLLRAGNPINYAVFTRLSSAEAIAAALYITGFKEQALEIINKFKWGRTFLSLNIDVLEEYSNASTREEIIKIQEKYLRKYGLT